MNTARWMSDLNPERYLEIAWYPHAPHNELGNQIQSYTIELTYYPDEGCAVYLVGNAYMNREGISP